MQAALRLLYPGHCVTCTELVEEDFGICPTCWGKTHFIVGTVCDACGTPLPGEQTAQQEYCDDCMASDRAWSRGRSTLLYKENGRRLVLALKHGDRQDIARPAGQWMARAVEPLILPGMLIAPVPLHWMRLLKRRFNQSALLAHSLADHIGHPCIADLLVRQRSTQSLDGRTKDQRFSILAGAISVHRKRRHLIEGQPVLLVDDVMTSGATLEASARACLASGASEVRILTLARAVKDA